MIALPPADDRLYGPDNFAAGWLVAAIAAVVVAVVALLWALWPSDRRRIVAEHPHVLQLRDRYLLHLDELERHVATNELTTRALHHELSRTLRRYATEVGAGRATSMSASALEAAGQRHIAAAIRRFEHPQFEEDPAGDPFAALGVARAVVVGPTGDDDPTGAT